MNSIAEQQADAFRIRMLIGPVIGRVDSILEFVADQIECGEIDYDPETQIMCFAGTDSRLQVQPHGGFRKIG
jgi:hypothetical protein